MRSDPQKFQRRIERFLIVRLAVIPMAFILVAVYGAGLAPGPRMAAFPMLYGLLGFYTLLAVGAFLVRYPLRWPRLFTACQVALDFLVAAVLIGVTGGVASVFCPLLFAMLFNASTVLQGKGVLAFASVSTAFLAVTLIGYQLGQNSGPFHWWGRPVSDPAWAASHLFALGLALHAVAFLGTRLAKGLRSVQSIQAEIIENIGEGLVAVDGKRRILELNSEARRIFSIPDDVRCAGRPLDEIFAGEALRPVREAFLGEEPRRFEFSLTRPDSERQPVEAKVSEVAGDGGRLRCRIGLFGDLTLKKEMEEAGVRIHKLEELYDMAMGIAHEIRNPLASIQGCAQEIGRSSSRDGRELKLVDIICRESGRLDRIIEDFMTSARQGPPDLQPVDLFKLLEETVLQCEKHPRAGSRRFILEPPGGPVRISGDAARLKQVFLNLGLNAMEATDPASGEIRVSFRNRDFLALNRRRAGERRMVPGVEVEFADNGPGISPEERKLIFTPFFSTKEKGQGIGLAIVHRVVRDHLGTVDLESEPGKGTRFRVWFPRLQGESGIFQRSSSPAREVTSV